MLLKRIVPLFLLACLLLPSVAQAQLDEQFIKEQEDARIYLEMIDLLKDAPLDEQIAGWEKFLKKNQNSYFAEEIESNLESMKARLRYEEKVREEEDSRLYFKVVERAAGEPLPQQIYLWNKFLKEHPESLFSNEARTTLNRLKQEAEWAGKSTAGVPPKTKPAPAHLQKPTSKPVAAKPVPEPEDYLSSEKAVFLAAVPGVVVPGLGHFYAKSYVIGGLLAALRVTGLILLGVGIYEGNDAVVVPGAAVAGFSYAMDVIMAPILARNYNYALEPLPEEEDARLHFYPTFPLALVSSSHPMLRDHVTHGFHLQVSF